MTTHPSPQEHFKKLDNQWQRLSKTHMRDLFLHEPDRFKSMSLTCGTLMFDFSKTRLDDEAISGLVDLASHMGVEDKRAAMLGGEKINTTEDRAVLHTALRNKSGKPVLLEGMDVMPEINEVLARLERFAASVRSGEFTVSGGEVTDVVNIGIGGSDLGPKMVTKALGPYCDGPRVHYVSNVDGADIADVLSGLKLENTLFIIASKTFTTAETMANARTAMALVQQAVGEKASDHFCALSTNLEATREFGIPDERTFGFWDWVGGRYSVWSAIGLSTMLAIGPERFAGFLQGAYDADRHFAETQLRNNIPVMMALIGIWHRNICGYSSLAVLPYENRLEDFSRWLQQLDMESNGKRVNLHNEPIDYATGPIVFGEPGTNGQHAFYQLIHQGTEIIPCDFLVGANGHEPDLDHQHQLLLSNCLAQSEALMHGRSLEEAGNNPHKEFSGNRPSCTFIYDKLDPYTLGMIMAFYEHKIFVQGVIWNINSFDQWGVELGKELAKKLEPVLLNGDASEVVNSSTKGLLSALFKFRK